MMVKGLAMTSHLVAAVLCGLAGLHCIAADQQPSTTMPAESVRSPLLAEGDLQKTHETLSQIFQFKSKSDALQLDRAAWEPIAKQIEEKIAADNDPVNLPPGITPGSPQALRFQARMLEEKARQLERQQRMGQQPPLFALFQKIEDDARGGSRSFSRGGPSLNFSNNGKWKQLNSSFRGTSLGGTLSSNNDSDHLTLEEASPPTRTLELVAAIESDAFRVQLSDPEGNLVLLRQLSDGGCSVVTMLSGKVQCYEGKSFADLCQHNRAAVETDVLPAFEQFGIYFPCSKKDCDGGAR
jgi:hypothetical protein